MTPSQLKRLTAETSPHFFTRDAMRFFGDTMSNYGVRGPVTVTTHSGGEHQCWELYRRRPVKHGLRTSTYFDCETFERRFQAEEKR